MKNAIKLLGFVIFIVIIGFSYVSCKDNDSSGGGSVSISADDLQGTWKHTNGSFWNEITFSGNTFESIIFDDSGVKGTFTISGNTLTINGTHSTNNGGSTWTSTPPISVPYTVSLSGNNLTMNDGSSPQVYIKQ